MDDHLSKLRALAEELDKLHVIRIRVCDNGTRGFYENYEVIGKNETVRLSDLRLAYKGLRIAEIMAMAVAFNHMASRQQ